jgi:hypothetical protein
MRHSRIADLAASFPALLFALAVPRPARSAPRSRDVLDGAASRSGGGADLPLWTAKAASEAFARADCATARRRTVSPTDREPSSAFTQARADVAAGRGDVAELAHEPAAVWIARELVREPQRVKPARLRLISLWAWFSVQPATFGTG